MPIIVEGKYDKIKLDSLVDATVFTTDGFALFKKAEKAALLRRLASEHGVIVLTDSDGGGTQIRSFLSGILPKEKTHHLYIPRIEGKEKRKDKPSRAGTLGVEGMEGELLYKLLSPFATDGYFQRRGGIDKRRLYLDGLSGTENASEKRAALARALSLPPDLSANALLCAINLLYTEEEYQEILEKTFSM
jgi:ribonuclease M5